jgi:AraC-like DNA-binding protein
VSTNIVRKTGTKGLSTLPTATGGIARLAYVRARQAGIDSKLLVRKSGLADVQIKDRGVRINVQQQIQFLNLVALALRDDLLGFHLAQSSDLRELGLLYYVASSSETLGDALQRVARYVSIVNEGLALRCIEGQKIKIIFDYVSVSRHSDRHQIEFCMTALIRLCRQLTGQHLTPSCARLTHRSCKQDFELTELFGRNVEFAARCDELIFHGAIKEASVVSTDPYLNKLMVANCEAVIARRPTRRRPLRSAVENAIAPLLPHGKARASVVARQLGMSQRTLSRRLSLEDITFSKVLVRLRSDLSRQYLKDPALSISRIAWLLGYQEVGAFTNAFKRWTGKTPRQARPHDPKSVFQRSILRENTDAWRWEYNQ